MNFEREKNLSNRKRKRMRYARFQMLFKRNRKGPFDSLFNNNSLSDDLRPNEMFDYWSHLMINKPGELEAEMDSDPSILVYPVEVKEVESRTKSAAGPDGLSVYQINKISLRICAKLFPSFFYCHGFLRCC